MYKRQVMLKCFFGFYPDVQGHVLHGNIPSNFSGTLHHVRYGDEYYTITADKGAVKMKKERSYD